MPEASPFLQRFVRLYAYVDFARTVASYYKEASRYNQQDFLLFEGYTIFRDRWPASDYSSFQFYEQVHKVLPYVRPVYLDHDKAWYDILNLKQDRRSRLSLQEYASRGGFGSLTFPEDDIWSNDDSDSSEEDCTDSEEDCTDTDEGDHQTTEPEWLRKVKEQVENDEADISDPSLPKRRMVKIWPQS